MKAFTDQQSFLSKQELNLPQIIQNHLANTRIAQAQLIQNQKPYIFHKKHQLKLSIIFTLLIVLLNFDQLFLTPPPTITSLEKFQSPNQISRKIQSVFQLTFMKISILYPLQIKQCQSYLTFLSENFCSEKSANLNVTLQYQIGFKPNLQSLNYNAINNTFVGQWGPLQIISVIDKYNVKQQASGLFASWGIEEFQKKYQQNLKILKNHGQKRIGEYIESKTSKQNSLQSFKSNIRNSLMRIIEKERQNKIEISKRFLGLIDKCFDKLLMAFKLDPLGTMQKQKSEAAQTLMDENFEFEQEVQIEEEQIEKMMVEIQKIERSDHKRGQYKDLKGQQNKQQKGQKNINQNKVASILEKGNKDFSLLKHKLEKN